MNEAQFDSGFTIHDLRFLVTASSRRLLQNQRRHGEMSFDLEKYQRASAKYREEWEASVKLLDNYLLALAKEAK